MPVRQDFPYRPDQPRGPASFFTRSTASFPTVKRADCGVEHPSSSSAGLRMGWSSIPASLCACGVILLHGVALFHNSSCLGS